jgi:hypothetical protein
MTDQKHVVLSRCVLKYKSTNSDIHDLLESPHVHMVKQFATEIYAARAMGIVLSEDLRVRIRRSHQACCRIGEWGVGWRLRRFVVSVSSTSVK